jgi:AcrR family transcriptional regulator
LLELGLQLFGKFTYDELSIDLIAKTANISKGLLYHYFPNKRIFYIETVRAAAERLLKDSEVKTSGNAWERLQQVLLAYLKCVEDHATVYLSLLGSGVGVDPEVAQIVEKARESFFQRILDVLQHVSPTPQQKVILYGWIGFVEAVSEEWLKNKVYQKWELASLIQSHLGFTLRCAGMEIPQLARQEAC